MYIYTLLIFKVTWKIKALWVLDCYSMWSWGSTDGNENDLHYFDIEAMLSENSCSERWRVLCASESCVLLCHFLICSFLSVDVPCRHVNSDSGRFFLIRVWTCSKDAWPDWTFLSVTHVVLITLLHFHKEHFSGQDMARSERQPLRADVPHLCHGRAAADVDIWW